MRDKKPAQFELERSRARRRFIASFAIVAATFVVGWASVSTAAAQEEKKNGAGAYISGDVTAKDVGLPIYPGAMPHKDKKDEDTTSTTMGLWGGSFAFKLAVMKLDSNDSPDKVAAFYQKALAKYGPVLNCTNVPSRAEGNDKGDSPKKLDCDSDKPEPGEMVFKSGTKERQHIAAIKPNGSGSLIQLIYVQVPHSENK